MRFSTRSIPIKYQIGLFSSLLLPCNSMQLQFLCCSLVSLLVLFFICPSIAALLLRFMKLWHSGAQTWRKEAQYHMVLKFFIASYLPLYSFPFFPHLFGQIDVNLIVVVTSAFSIKHGKIKLWLSGGSVTRWKFQMLAFWMSQRA